MTVANMAEAVEFDSGSSCSMRPQTPEVNGLSLTEYASNPSPPSATPKPKASTQVPEAFLLPNGTPDVQSNHETIRPITDPRSISD